MIPARLGSQRLKKKNLRLIKSTPLIIHAIRKVKNISLFDEVWANSEADEIGNLAIQEGVFFHKRPAKLASNIATSEDFVYEFISAHRCDYVVQIHSIAPLLKSIEIELFTQRLQEGDYDVLLSVERIGIECIFNNEPVNFSFNKKENSQDLEPVYRISWSITGWKAESYKKAYESGLCATYSGRIGTYEINRFSSHVIKEQIDLSIAESLLDLINKGDD